ncbi:MAG: aromatic ring-hydroxylating dioxygenase subunit alpha [Sphingomonadales bacterium]|nr:aromatic ring-hydroxylating dioxygenase subunit alpha [Sphingomonadales bacterium]
MLDVVKSASPSIPFEITDPERIPAARYYDEEFYKLEVERLWPHMWQMACRLEQIPEPGDWVEYSNVGKSVLIVRTETGVKAYHNACRHRGVPIAGGHGNEGGKPAFGNCSSQGFVCPFHGWRWNMDGENTLVYGAHHFNKRQLDPNDIKLVECRVEEAIGCAWINFDNDAPSFRETQGPLIDRLEAHNLHKLRAEWWYQTTIPANWKIAMEAFMEGYHVMTTHPQLQDAVPNMYDSRYRNEGPMSLADPKLDLQGNIDAQLLSMARLSEGMAGMLHAKELEIARGLRDYKSLGIDFPEDTNMALMMWLGVVQAQIVAQLQARGEPVPDLNTVCQTHPVNAVEFLMPHYFLLPYFSSFSAYRIRPTGPEECIFELWSLTTFPEGQEPEPVMEPRVLPYDSAEFPPIPRQDYSNIPIQQKGLHAQGFEFMRLAENVEGMVSNYQRIIDGYLKGADPKKLAEATTKLGGNFDGPILELGL